MRCIFFWKIYLICDIVFGLFDIKIKQHMISTDSIVSISSLKWVVPENIRTPTTDGILEFRMHGGGSLAWNSECVCGGGGGVLGLEFRMHEGVSSPGIPRGGELKTLIYWLLKFRKPVSYVRLLNKLSRKGMTMKLGCAAYLELPKNACFWQLFQ